MGREKKIQKIAIFSFNDFMNDLCLCAINKILFYYNLIEINHLIIRTSRKLIK